MSRTDRASFHMTNDPFEASRDDKYECPRLSFGGQISVDTHIDCGGLRLPMKITANPSREEVPGQDFLTFALEVQCGNHGIADADVTRLARSEAFQIAKRYVQVTAWNLQQTAVNISRSGLQTLRAQRHATTGAHTAAPGLLKGQLTVNTLPSKLNPPNSPEDCRATTIDSANSGLEGSSDLRHSQQPTVGGCSDANVPTSTSAGTNTYMQTEGFSLIDDRNRKIANAISPSKTSPKTQVRKHVTTRKKRRKMDTAELEKAIVMEAIVLVKDLLEGAQILEKRLRRPAAAELWSSELLQLKCTGHMGFQELFDFYTDRSRKFTYRGWEANFMAHLAQNMLKTVGTSAGERSALSRQRKWLKAPLSLVNAAYPDVGPVAYNIFSALGGEQGPCIKLVLQC